MDKGEKWLALKEECTNFFEKNFQDTRKDIVFGAGDLDAAIMLIGEAPGRQEIEQRKPFVGAAGKNLDEFIEILQIDRRDIYIGNVVKFRPFKINPKTNRQVNRPPTQEEISLCKPYLEKEIEIIEPKIIVTLGNTPLKAISEDQEIKIGDVHGSPMTIHLPQYQKPLNIYPLYHPASIIYRRQLKEIYIEDVKKLKRIIHS
ncbi:uracil-DNA glycosylase [Irregularibacter muris]|uniref:Type-4 uracil-DNA glycosylase n=1 Tax=Irregularibacter muris TaxID=1796619 RepID=A0AAE3L017_9FIRM|nr:uracil-DNA glycosylase [Irregularibacter muris]MCR1899551.1 uracil-DNA glycosylase [Irregularibacter muris]